MHGDRIALLDEGARVATICNACRYCEGHCAVFPALERRTVFAETDLDRLAQLCHQCGACYAHCQYAAPHEFDVNVPVVMAKLRLSGYAKFARPTLLGQAFEHGLWFSVVSFVALLLFFVGGAIGINGADSLIRLYPQGFYDFMPHVLMAGIFAVLALFVICVWVSSLSAYWRQLELPAFWHIQPATYWQALLSGMMLKNLDGGHERGCYEVSDEPSQWRRRSHHLVMYGFLLCFAATLTGTIYHYGFQYPAPYPWLSLPKLFGTVGGLMLITGCTGLGFANVRIRREIEVDDGGLGHGLLVLLFFTGLTGLMLPLLRDSVWMALMLCTHLASVAALFLNFACGKFVHGLYRLVALVADEHEISLNAPDH